MKKRVIKNKEGSALLIAIVIMMVVTMLSLALLLVSYSLFATSNKQNNDEQCRTLAQSLSLELEKEITISPFEKYEMQKQAHDDGKYPLWFYLRFNVWQSNWPYYNAEERGHSDGYAWRYFKLNADESSAATVVDDISVLIYWESEADAQKAATPLVVEVTCKKGSQQYTVKSTYELVIEVDPYEDAQGMVTVSSPYNPLNNQIDSGEIWNWSLSERE